MRHSISNKTKLPENVRAGFAILWCVSTSWGASASLPNGRDLVQRSLEAGERNEQRLREYVSRTRSDFKQFAQDGSIKSEEVKTFDYVAAEGFYVRSLVEKDDKPLSAADHQKEDARVNRLAAQRKRESPRAREKRLEESKEKQEKDRRFTHELLDAFDFRVVGDETIDGRKTWVLDATPNQKYHAKELRTQMFAHLRGRVWVDQQDLLWVKAEAEAEDDFSVGFSVVAKLDKGAHLSLEQVRQPDGTWVVRKVGLKASGRIALVKRFSIESVGTSSGFRKVSADQRIGDGKDEF